jgi:tetratricopeptide (TPR) repeat protein
MMENLQTQLAQAIAYRNQDQFDEAQEAFATLYERYPDDALVNYHYAWLCDKLGEERRAVPFYERAIELGLPGEESVGALLGLGSTYRSIGEYQKSTDILARGVAQFPNAKQFPVFLAMTLYNLRQHRRAMQSLLHIIADHVADDDVARYKRAIHFYADDLDTVWE